MKVSALMATYGRKSKVEETLACFLNQDYADRELVILNTNPIPLLFSHPLVRIYNESQHTTLGHCRNRLLELAIGDLVRSWDDDDLYMPWSIRQGVENIGNAPAFRPRRSWWSRGIPGKCEYELFDNVFEAAVTTRIDVARTSGYKLGEGDEHCILFNEIDRRGGLKMIEFGVLTSYIYRFACGVWHASGQIDRPAEEHAADWKAHNVDTGDGITPLVPASVDHYWADLVTQATQKYGESEGHRLALAFGFVGGNVPCA